MVVRLLGSRWVSCMDLELGIDVEVEVGRRIVGSVRLLLRELEIRLWWRGWD